MKYNMKKVLTAAVLAAVITGTASCGQQQYPAATSAPTDTTVSAAETEGTANVTESEAGDTETEDVTEAQTDAGSIDPMSADYSKIDIEILPDSGEEIVNFTNDMLAGLYDGKIVKCTGRTSRRMTGNAMMQEQPDGTFRGFTWLLADTDDADAYPPDDATAEITGIVGTGEYGVRYLYVPSANVKTVSSDGSESNASPNENTILADGAYNGLIESAKAYYAGNHDGYVPTGASVEPQEDGTVAVQLFDDLDDHTATLEWYFIDPSTLKGTDLQGNAVDLDMSAGSENDTGNGIPAKIIPEPWDPPVVHRQVMFDEGEFFGVRYLGWIDPKVTDFDSYSDYIGHILEETGTYEDFEFTKDMPHDRFVSSPDGQELYLVIPFDREGSVYVVEQVAPGEPPGEATEWMYRSNDGAPFLLKCNVSEIYPDVKVIFLDSEGQHAEWYPGISGKDGTVITTNDTNRKVHDFTSYDKLANPDNAPLG